ncbi:uncharacterized protein LOC143875738 [Tasmannia lanceolata]|uniref:uncharacterized protein LOC143875738 n=1 Tax=Tasmannia lanceolata TaxID=3420 RepID=UPI00406364E1
MFKSNRILLPLILILIFLPKPFSLGSPVQEQSLNRPDPSQKFRPYHGYYDVRNLHYWTSAVFTGVHGYAMAGFWILCGFGFGIFVMVSKNLNVDSASTEHSDSYNCILVFILVLFTSLVIIVSGIVLAANRSYHRRAWKLKQTLLGGVDDARRTIRRVTGAMNEMHQRLYPYDETMCFRLNSTSIKLKNESETIRRIAAKNRHSIDLALRISYGTTAGVVSISLITVVAALVLLLLHWRPGFIMIIFICWFLTALCWALAGFHFFLHTFTEDTCAALDGFEQSPKNNSLRSILPCVNHVSADSIMIEIGSGIHSFVNELNKKITKLDGLMGLDDQHEEPLRKFTKVCNPFSGAPEYKFDPGRCSKDTIPIGEISEVLEKITCPRENSAGICDGGRKFLSEASFIMAQAYTLSIQGLINVLPDLQRLTHCSFIEETFSDVLHHQCRPLRVSVRLLWSSMVSLSIGMMVLEVGWIAKAYQNKGRSFSMGSIIPKAI